MFPTARLAPAPTAADPCAPLAAWADPAVLGPSSLGPAAGPAASAPSASLGGGGSSSSPQPQQQAVRRSARRAAAALLDEVKGSPSAAASHSPWHAPGRSDQRSELSSPPVANGAGPTESCPGAVGRGGKGKRRATGEAGAVLKKPKVDAAAKAVAKASAEAVKADAKAEGAAAKEVKAVLNALLKTVVKTPPCLRLRRGSDPSPRDLTYIYYESFDSIRCEALLFSFTRIATITPLYATRRAGRTVR